MDIESLIYQTPEGWWVLNNPTHASCSDRVRECGRIEWDAFNSIDRCRSLWSHGATVIDVGANIGCWSVPMSRCVGSNGCVVSIEAEPSLFSCLEKNLSSFPWAIPIKAAAWDTTGPNIFLRNTQNCDSGAMTYNPPCRTFDAINVRSVKLDDLYEDLDLSDVSFIKIDVEGAELHVLKGCEETLRRHHPVLFLETMEHAQNLFGNTIKDLYDWIRNLGYSIELDSYEVTHDILCTWK